MNKIKLLFVLLCLITIACVPKKGSKKIIVNNYRVDQTPADKSDDDFIFWYIIMSTDNNYYSYSSPRAVSSFSGVNWTVSSTRPAVLEEQNLEELQEMDVEPDELSAEVQEAVTETEVDATADEASSNDGADSDAGSDAGDSGSDGGGGDSGGGDGGGE